MEKRTGIFAGDDPFVGDVFGPEDCRERSAQRRLNEQAQSRRRRQAIGFEIAFELRAGMAQACRDLPAGCGSPDRVRRRCPARRLCRAIAVERQRSAFAHHARIGVGQRPIEAQRAACDLQARLDPLRLDRGKVLPLAQIARERDIRDRPFDAIVEGRFH